jgi:tetratricopeptide (TPR) repeat protein
MTRSSLIMLRRLLTAIAIATAFALSAEAATPRIAYERILPPLHNLGGDDIVLIHAMGDAAALAPFIDTLVEHANRTGDLRMDTVERRQLYNPKRPDAVAMRRIRRDFPRDVYIAIDAFACATSDHEGEGSTYNSSGDRVKRHQYWSDATCRASIAVVDAGNGTPISRFETSGEGTSPRVAELTPEEREIARAQAAHFAGVTAAGMIAQRRIRESIELDPSVPDFDRAMSLIDADRLPAARRLLEIAARKQHATPELWYDIAAICEALGDLPAAQQNYQAAIALAPRDPRWQRELILFHRRTGYLQKTTAQKQR